MNSRPQSPRRLSAQQVIRIRQMRKEGFTRWFLAQHFKISVTALQHILNYATYKDVK